MMVLLLVTVLLVESHSHYRRTEPAATHELAYTSVDIRER